MSAQAQQPPRGFIIGVEGNIGVGKTLFCENLARELSAKYIPERVPVTALYDFYADPKAKALMFEHSMAKHKAERYAEAMALANEHHIVVIERTPWSSQAFVMFAVQEGFMLKEDAEKLKVMGILEPCYPNSRRPDLMILLSDSPYDCFRRVQARDRAEERGLSLCYLNNLGLCISEWFHSYCGYNAIPYKVVYPHQGWFDHMGVAGGIIATRAIEGLSLPQLDDTIPLYPALSSECDSSPESPSLTDHSEEVAAPLACPSSSPDPDPAFLPVYF